VRRLSIISALLLWGCANAGIEPAALDSQLQTGAITPPTDAGEAARGEMRKVQHKAVEEARRPVRAFLAEKGTDCASPRLKEAVHKVIETAVAVASTMKPDYPAMLEAGAAALDVADGAKRKGCAHDARLLYDFVLTNFSGLGYAALRDRAGAGIRDLRAKGSRAEGPGT
jgi:hypothetical protein